MTKRTIEERFWAKVDTSAGPDGCWLWTASGNPGGYGQFGLSRAEGNAMAHRFAYELLVGPIPDGLHIDHLCRVRRCVNPRHLEAVTCRENILRGVGASAIHAAQTHCIWGHEFTPENTRIDSRGDRVCRACDKRRRHERYVRHRPASVTARGSCSTSPSG